MGTVFAAHEVSSGEPAAIKVLSAALAAEEGFRERFRAEIETLKKLRHPSIVRLYGWGEQDGHLFYAMELVPGTSLEEELRRGRRFDWRETTEIGIQIARALKHAHDHGVIHRDIKPANVLLTSTGEAKLSDFGIARLFGNVGLTVDGGVLGTAEYMSPEQADGRPVTDRCDLYSLGGTLYALLAGRAPFRARSLPEMLQLQRFASPDPIRRFAPETPPELEEIVLQLLQKEPERRVPSAAVLARRLEATFHGLSQRQQSAAEQAETLANTDFAVQTPPGEPSAAPNLADSSQVTRLGFSTALAEAVTAADPLVEGMPVARAEPATPARPVPPVSVTTHSAPTQLPRLEDRAGLDTTNEIPVAPPQPPVARFTTVAESDDQEDEEATPVVVRVLQVGLLLFAMASVVALGWYLAQPPSADKLYQQVVQAEQRSGFEGLLESEDAIEQFLEHYPKDPRRGEISGLKADVQTYRRTRNFQRRLERLAQQGELAPWERAFVEANRLADTDPEAALRRLGAVVTLYSPEAEHSRPASELLQLARQRIETLRKDLIRRQSQDLAAIQLQLQRATELARENPALSRSIWQAVVDLYADKPWASEVVGQARRLLESPAQPAAASPVE